MAASNVDRLTPVSGDASSTPTDPQLNRSNVADEPPRGSGSVSLFANLWNNTSPAVDLTTAESVDENNGAHSAGWSQLTSSTLVPRFRHRASKSTSSRTSVSSQPILVRAYTAGDRSRPPSRVQAPQAPIAMPTNSTLPPIEAFSFNGILRAVDPDIHEAIDGIAEIYARSRLSLADEYGAHLPPQGEILDSPRIRRSGLAIRTIGLERALTTVTEASSSSERLAGGSKAGSTTSEKGKMTAYGSLRSIISRGRSSSAGSAQAESSTANRMLPPTWKVTEDGHPSIVVQTRSSAPKQLSLDTAAELPRDKAPVLTSRPNIPSSPREVTRATSWFSWRKSYPAPAAAHSRKRPNAESALKNVLQGKPRLAQADG